MSKTFEMIAAGFGGQGVLGLGQIVAYSAMFNEKHTTWLPSYGPEMRGGTANCSVVVSDTPIANPMITRPNVLVAMNGPSLDKFINTVVPGGYVFINSSIIDTKVEREDLKVFYVPTIELAVEGGNPRGANVVMLGAVIEGTGMVDYDKVVEGVEYYFSKKPQLIDPNKKMLEIGKNAVNK